MAYTIDRVKEEFYKICKNANVECSIPITLNTRLSRTLGRVFCEYKHGKYIATSAEFSSHFLETSTDESIYSVIQHEACHYIATTRSGNHHGHDSYFKAICKEIGCTNDGTQTHVERTVAAIDVYKYLVYCPNCGEIGHYNRWCKTLKELSYCTCKNCCSQELWYEER